jgi:ribonucleoside-diphosphate reductase beta chain
MIFEEQISRKPDYYPWTQNYIEAMQNGFWTHREFNFQSDIQDYKVTLTPQEREIIVRALSTIGQLEISVKKFWAKVGENLPHPTINDLGYVMANSEVVHGDAYERLLDVLGIDDSFDRILQEDIIRGRVTYLRKYLQPFAPDKKKQFVYSLILFTLFVENIALFSQFYTISYFGRFRNLLKDTNKQVEYTSREENLHAMIGIKLINVIRDEHPELFDDELKQKIISESLLAIEYECKIIDWIVNGYSVENLNTPLLREFIKNRMNESLVQIGFEKLFEVDKEMVKKTLWFDEQILGNNMTDFFHSRPIEYSKKGQSFNQSDLF